MFDIKENYNNDTNLIDKLNNNYYIARSLIQKIEKLKMQKTLEAQENCNKLMKIWNFIINFDRNKKDDKNKNKLKDLFNVPEIKENIKRNMIKKPF